MCVCVVVVFCCWLTCFYCFVPISASSTEISCARASTLSWKIQLRRRGSSQSLWSSRSRWRTMIPRRTSALLAPSSNDQDRFWCLYPGSTFQTLWFIMKKFTDSLWRNCALFSHLRAVSLLHPTTPQPSVKPPKPRQKRKRKTCFYLADAKCGFVV